MKILNFGSLNIDYVYSVDHFVRPGETISSSEMNVFPGGKGLNQSVALARAGAAVFHAGAVGTSDGNILVDLLSKNNVDVEFINKVNTSSGHAIIQVNSTGQNCIMLYGGANQTITEQHIDNTLKFFGKDDFIVLQNEINNLGYIIKRSHEAGLKIVLNPSPMNTKIMQLPLENVDYFVLNEVEAEDICGMDCKDNLLYALSEKYPAARIILTLGKSGVEYKYKKVVLKHGIYQVPVADTTAAGDTFTGYFIGCLSQGHTAERALELASIASSISVSRNGASSSIPHMNEVLNSNLKKI